MSKDNKVKYATSDVTNPTGTVTKFTPKPSTNREAVARIIQKMAARHVSLLAAQATADQILLLWPKVLSDEEINEVNDQYYIEDMGAMAEGTERPTILGFAKAISQKTVEENKEG